MNPLLKMRAVRIRLVTLSCTESKVAMMESITMVDILVGTPS